jgi:hypothetical protein
MKRINFFWWITLAMLSIAGCSADQEIRVYAISYPFISSDQGWTGHFADYPIDSTGYHLHAEHDTLAFNINTDSTRKAIRISGNSLNSDLFMFLKRKITGLKPATTYQVLFTVRLASTLPTKGTNVAATLGEQTYLKVGALAEEPVVTLVDEVYEVNVNKGELAADGTDMVTIGTVAVTSSTRDYTLITRYNASPKAVYATTNEAGELWLMVGTDIAANGRVTLYYTQIDVLLNQADD